MFASKINLSLHMDWEYLKSNRHATAAHHRQKCAIPFQLPKFVNLCHVDAIPSHFATGAGWNEDQVNLAMTCMKSANNTAASKQDQCMKVR